ncbi:glutathione S-transferase family protein [Ruegeria sp. 1NDH52C]|uniref:Glutathione S-transferase family protein n=1 Tax=Ruegeria alba TaxID=2916756 RepID=A0ABS9NUN4_9RHOB|nr:glutathione S-transferase family protein [Ruegeria alba]MCG6557930.1 glutathione S-transferase family protein [Ruegeria alba]
MQLYCAPGTISVAVAIALHEAGIEHEKVQLDFRAAEQTRPAYHQINPKGRVPALVVPGGVLTETGALLEFIADSAPDKGLVPADQLLRARMREVMYYLASTMHVNHAHKLRGARWADRADSWADMTAKVPETMTASATYVETNGLRGPFVLGEAVSIADCYLYVVTGWLEGDGVDLEPFPTIRAFRAAMEARASVQAVKAAGLL